MKYKTRYFTQRNIPIIVYLLLILLSYVHPTNQPSFVIFIMQLCVIVEFRTFAVSMQIRFILKLVCLLKQENNL